MKEQLKKYNLPEEVAAIVNNCKSLIIPKSREELLELSFGGEKTDQYDVCYDV